MVFENEESLQEEERDTEAGMDEEVTSVAVPRGLVLHELEQPEPIQNDGTHTEHCRK